MIIINGTVYEIKRETAKIAAVDHKYYKLLETMDDSYKDLKFNQDKDYNMLKNMEMLIQEKDDTYIEKVYGLFLRNVALREKYGSTYDPESYLSKDYEDRKRLKEIFEYLITKKDAEEPFDVDNKVSLLFEEASNLVEKDKQKTITEEVM